MAKKFLTPISVLNLSADPQSANEGDIYYNTSSDVLRIYANSQWVDVSGGESLPDQSGNSGKYLTTNGTSASWDAINLGTDTTGSYVATIAGTTNEIEVTGSGSESAAVTLSLPATINANTTGSAASLTTARTIALTGDVSGSASFDGSASVSISSTLANSGVSANSYGSASAVGTFTVDSKGRLTASSNTPIAIAQSAVTNLTTDLSAKAPLASPALTGTPTAPTAAAGTNTTQIATTAFVQSATAALVDAAPTTLDTLNELAAALGDDPNFATTVSTALGNKQPLDADLTAIAGLAGTSGFLKKTAAETWALDTNTYLTGNQTITLTGDVSGSGTTSISVTVADDSHNHIISNVDGLQTALDAKSPLASPTFTGALSVINANSSTIPMAYGSRFGYSTGYRILVIGDTNSSNFNSVGIGYDPISNASGSFTGNGGEVFFRNAVKFKTPNADNNGFLTPMEFTSTGIVDIKNDLIVSGGDITLGGTGRIQGIDTVSANTDAANKTYVDTGLGLKADDNTVVHLAGTETITGAKTFSATINGADIHLTGSLTATSKSFDIEHPTKEGMRLRYGSLEGEEHGVYIRGKSKSSTITLPDYWTGLVDEDSITVQLTPIGKHKKLYVKDISNNTVTIGGCRGEFEFFYFIQAERKDIDKLVVEY